MLKNNTIQAYRLRQDHRNHSYAYGIQYEDTKERRNKNAIKVSKHEITCQLQYKWEGKCRSQSEKNKECMNILFEYQIKNDKK